MGKFNVKRDGNQQNIAVLGRRKRGKYGLVRKIKPRIYAALDLGTNNCRLLLAQPLGTGFKVVSSFSRVVKLGEGLTESGNLSDTSINRTIKALSICSNKLKVFDVVK